MDPETPYLLPDGERVWVHPTTEATKLLANLLKLYRGGESGPLIFGDAGQPEAVVIPWETWCRLDALAADEDGFDHVYDIARESLADPRPSIPLEEAAAQIGWDLDEDEDSDPPKER